MNPLNCMAPIRVGAPRKPIFTPKMKTAGGMAVVVNRTSRRDVLCGGRLPSPVYAGKPGKR